MSAEFRIGQAVPRHQIGWGDTLLKHASRVALALAAFACFWLFVLPVIVVALSSVSTQWSGTILPAGYSLRWFERLGSPEYDALLTSLEIGFGVSAIGTILGLWLALALEGRDRRGLGAVVDALVMVPNGVPSVVLGLAVLIAYHQKPLDLSSSAAIVVLVQLALILPFCYRCAAAALRPDYPEAINNLGVLYVREQELQKAEQQFRACIRVSPNFDQAYLNLARLYVMQSNRRKAKDVLQELLRLQPQNTDALQAMDAVSAMQ